MIEIEGAPTLRLNLAETAHLSSGRGTDAKMLLFGLSLAAALPPAAILFPTDSSLPFVRSNPYSILSPAEVGAILGRPMAEVGRGRVALGEVDRRMHRLVVALNVFQATDGSGVLVSLGVIRVDPAATTVAGVSPLDLWALAGEPLSRHGVAKDCPIRIGDRSRLIVYGGITSQVAWLSGERLATASVTSLQGSESWVTGAACSIAVLLDRGFR
jgi:hypothetical protein